MSWQPTPDTFIGGVGTLASLAGVILSYFALIAARDAKTAAESARDKARKEFGRLELAQRLSALEELCKRQPTKTTALEIAATLQKLTSEALVLAEGMFPEVHNKLLIITASLPTDAASRQALIADLAAVRSLQMDLNTTNSATRLLLHRKEQAE